MKKIFLIILIGIGVISTISYIYLTNVANYNNAQKENIKLESYKDQEITGSELVTVINFAIDLNSKNNVEKDNKGKYIDNNENSINKSCFM